MLKNSSEEVILNIYIPVMKKWARKKYEKSMRNSKFQEFFLTSQKSSKLTFVNRKLSHLKVTDN